MFIATLYTHLFHEKKRMFKCEKIGRSVWYSSSSSVYRGGGSVADGGVQFKIAKSKINKLPPPFGVLPL